MGKGYIKSRKEDGNEDKNKLGPLLQTMLFIFFSCFTAHSPNSVSKHLQQQLDRRSLAD
ncbi:MAG: hypothetical protein Q4A11_04680 [Brachymonas sp.]|nr:hypothetical protein [Brachymonas sp.]